MTTHHCEHLKNLTSVATPQAEGCQSCLEIGDTWVHLRSCLDCGRVGCCDDSKNTHARKHWTEHGHPLIVSIEPGESWRYCYEDHFLQR